MIRVADVSNCQRKFLTNCVGCPELKNMASDNNSINYYCAKNKFMGRNK